MKQRFGITVQMVCIAVLSPVFCAFALNAQQEKAHTSPPPPAGPQSPPRELFECGTVNPHMVAQSFGETSSSETVTNTKEDWLAVPNSPQTNLVTDASDNVNNGGYMHIAMSSTCDLLHGVQDGGMAIIDLKTHSDAQSGDCCGGNSPGGSGSTNPEWRGQINLPAGPDGQNDWVVTVKLFSSEAGPTPTCMIREVDTDTDTPVAANTSVSQSYSLKSGGHVFDISCSEGAISSRAPDKNQTPQDWHQLKSYDEEVRITITANRKISDQGGH